MSARQLSDVCVSVHLNIDSFDVVICLGSANVCLKTFSAGDVECTDQFQTSVFIREQKALYAAFSAAAASLGTSQSSPASDRVSHQLK